MALSPLPVEESKVSRLLDRLEWTRLDANKLQVELEQLAEQLRSEGLGVCRRCFCTDLTACDPPCSWIAADLCSACHGEEAAE